MKFTRYSWFPVAVAVAIVGGFGVGLATTDSTPALPGTTTAQTTEVTFPTSTTAAPGVTTTSDTTNDTADPDTTTSTVATPVTVPVDPTQRTWVRTGTSDGISPELFTLPELTALLTPDLDGDGDTDIVIGGRGGPESVQALIRTEGGWSRHRIESAELAIEAGGVAFDIDDDGDLDLVFGGDFSSNEVWWWENPGAALDPEVPWVRRTIKNDGGEKHHDMVAVDIDADGAEELIFWNQGSEPATLFAAEVPDDPTVDEPWSRRTLGTAGARLEGLDSGDLDLDGDVDLVAGGTLMFNDGTGTFSVEVINIELGTGRARIADVITGDRPEIVWDSGDDVGPLALTVWNGSSWETRELLAETVNGHSLDIGDIDGDGDLDILSAEMRLTAGDSAAMRLMINEGDGNFRETVIANGIDNHESKFADADGDGDLDIIGKPLDPEVTRVDVWLNETAGTVLNTWTRRVIDPERPDRAVFIRHGDLDGDGDEDLVAGSWWYENAGDPALPWFRSLLPQPLRQAALVYDLDDDGDLDVFGTEGAGSEPNSRLVWAQNDGTGGFTAIDNVPRGEGDFLQGVAAARFAEGRPLQILMSWHLTGQGVQLLTIPPGQATSEWQFSRSSPISQDEDLSVGDIDDDGDIDIMLGTIWVRNDLVAGTAITLHEPESGMPDRNELVDMDFDGDLDVVVTYEDPVNGRVAWYEQPDDLSEFWIEHPVMNLTMPLSLDVADLDNDGDIDIVVGEHSTEIPDQMGLYVLENLGDHDTWEPHLVHVGDEHHDGTQLVDLDGDGDLDIVSIGWTHGRVLVYENGSYP